MGRRLELLEDIKRLSGKVDCNQVMDLVFRILYGLDKELQFELALSFLREFLPIFKNKSPSNRWVSRFLADPYLWYETKGPFVLGEVPKNINIECTTFLFGLVGMYQGFCCKRDNLAVTSSVVSCISSCIHARILNLLLADEPGYYDMKRMTFKYDDVDSFCTEIGQLVLKRECKKIVLWFEEKNVFELKEFDCLDEIELGLKKFEENEGINILPPLKI